MCSGKALSALPIVPCENNKSYPFELEMDVSIDDLNDITVISNEIEVDTLFWFE